MSNPADTHWYVNRCAVDTAVVERVAKLLDSATPPTAASILELSALAEGYVLHDGLILVGSNGLALSADDIATGWPGSSIQMLRRHGAVNDYDAEQYSAAVMSTAGLELDELNPTLASLEDAWAEEDDMVPPDRRSDSELDEYELRIRAFE